MVKYLALAGLSLLPTSPALEQFESEPQRPHGVLCSMFYSPLVPHVTMMTSSPCDHQKSSPAWINNNSQSQSLNGNRKASRRWEGISLCLMSLICMQCCCHHWSLPLSRADISMGGSLVTGLTCSLADVTCKREEIVISFVMPQIMMYIRYTYTCGIIYLLILNKGKRICLSVSSKQVEAIKWFWHSQNSFNLTAASKELATL